MPIGQGEVALSRITDSLIRGGFRGPGIIRIDGHSQLGLAPVHRAITAFGGS
ncbi:hypothetical protein [Rubripirellula lacrimiformis]|uniref:hypothetical protein n=1 Tax=Rubripirellula lacrimiformis TaxID=1930273 RepID=UPI001C54D23B|nr:hypothetical protein [Rubripirellula lacrimiformis]